MRFSYHIKQCRQFLHLFRTKRSEICVGPQLFDLFGTQLFLRTRSRSGRGGIDGDRRRKFLEELLQSDTTFIGMETCRHFQKLITRVFSSNKEMDEEIQFFDRVIAEKMKNRVTCETISHEWKAIGLRKFVRLIRRFRVLGFPAGDNVKEATVGEDVEDLQMMDRPALMVL